MKNTTSLNLIRGLAVHEALHFIEQGKDIPITILLAARNPATNKLPTMLAMKLTKKQREDYRFTIESIEAEVKRQLMKLVERVNAAWAKGEGK